MIELLQLSTTDDVARRYVPHIEFAIAQNFFGPQQGCYMAEFIISAKNAGQVRHQFKTIIFVEPGVRQEICFTTRIEEDYRMTRNTFSTMTEDQLEKVMKMSKAESSAGP